jgi:hypothetical protein
MPWIGAAIDPLLTRQGPKEAYAGASHFLDQRNRALRQSTLPPSDLVPADGFSTMPKA